MVTMRAMRSYTDGPTRSLVALGIRRGARGLALAWGLSLAACADGPTVPTADTTVDPSWLAGDALARFDPRTGRFDLAASGRFISASQAEALAVAYARYIGTPYGLNGYIDVLQADRGGPIDFANLRPCGRTHYVTTPFGLPDATLPPTTRRMFGNEWAVVLCAQESAQLAVSVADDDGPGTGTDVFDLRTQDGLSAFFPIGLPARFTNDGPLGPEAAVAVAHLATGRRIVQAPAAYNAYTNDAAQHASCASWRIVLDSAVDVVAQGSGATVRTDTLYVMNLPACFSETPGLLVALPVQPRAAWLPLLGGDSVLVTLHGPIAFDRATIATR